MMYEIKQPLTKVQAKEIAEEYAKSKGYKLGQYMGKSREAFLGESYCWEAIDQQGEDGLIIGWPFWIAIEPLGGALLDNRPLNDLTGGDEIEGDE